MKTTLRIVGGLLVLALALPAMAAVTDADIDEAREQVNRLTAESAELGQAVIDAYGRQAALDAEIENLQASIDFARLEIAKTEARLQDLAVQLYIGTTSGASLSVLFAAGEQGAGLEYLREVNNVDLSVVDKLTVFRQELDRQTTRLAEALDEQVVLASELEEMAGELQVDLVAAQQVYDDLVAQQAAEEEERRRQEEEERRRREAEAAAATSTSTSTTATTSAPPSGDGSTTTTTTPATTTTTSPPPVPSGSGVCPVAGAVSFTDSWGAPRSGGRTHKGVDMIAARGTPIVAIYSGTVSRLSNSTLGGKSVYFYSDAGDLYYYAHLDDWGDIAAGQSVPAGYVLGYNGSTGNAPDYLPHLHFEYHPGGGSAVNPYPLVRDLC